MCPINLPSEFNASRVFMQTFPRHKGQLVKTAPAARIVSKYSANIAQEVACQFATCYVQATWGKAMGPRLFRGTFTEVKGETFKTSRIGARCM